MTTIGATWTATRAARPARPARTPLLLARVTWVARSLPAWGRVRTTVLQVAVFAFVDYSIWQWNDLVGYAAIGASLFLIEAFSGDRRARR